jgi:uncharacterized protein DUF4012
MVVPPRGWGRWACVAAAGAGGAAMGAAPSGNAVADVVAAAAFTSLAAAAGSCARPWTWLVVAGAATALAGDVPTTIAGAVALALALGAVSSNRFVRPTPTLGSLVAGLSAVALLGLDDLGFHGASALAAGAAVAPVLVSGYRSATPGARSRLRWLAAAGTAGLVLVAAAYGLVALRARSPLEQGLDRLTAGLAAARRGDDKVAARQFGAATSAFRRADRLLDGPWAGPARAVPVIGHNARAAATMVETAESLTRAATRAAGDADTDRLTVHGGRLDLDHVRSLEGPLDEVAAALRRAATRLDAARGPWLAGPVAQRLDVLADEVAETRPEVELAVDAVRVLPAVFGADAPSRWLVAFVTPVEARGRTGLVANYAELTATDGRVEMTRFGRADELERSGTPGAERTVSGPRDYLAQWGRFEPGATWRNITMSPHFPSVGRVMAELYPQSGGRPVDVVVALDPEGLAALLRFTGPIGVAGVGEPLTADNAARFLLHDQYLELPDKPTRVDVLESLARTTFDRLTTIDLPGPRALADALGDVVAGGHVHAFSPDADQQDLVEQVGLDGALPPVDGDALTVVSNNAVGNKIDLFLRRDVDYDVTWDPATEAVRARATVTLTNDAPRAGLPATVIGSSLPPAVAPAPGTNRTYLSIYSPWGLDEALVDGRAATVESQREQGRFVYTLLLDVPPDGGRRTVTLHLEGRIPDRDRYRLDVTTQPLVEPDRLTTSVDVLGRAAIVASPSAVLAGRTVTARTRLTSEETTYQVFVER